MGWRDRAGYWWGQLDRRRAKRELSEEIQSHLELEIQANLQAGMSEGEARRAALRRFGNPERYKEESYDASGLARLDGWLRDLAYAFRVLGKKPLFTVLTAGILALGIGPATAVFSVVHAVLLRPLPFEEPSRLVTISAAHDARGWDGFPIPAGVYGAFDQQSRALPDLAAYQSGSFTWVGGPEPLRLRGAEVTDGFFEVLGAAPLAGRVFGAGEQHGGEVLVSHGFWQRYLGGDPSAVGRTLRLEEEVRTIVGVMPPAFTYPEREVQLWLPLALDPADNPWGRWSLRAVARMAPGASLDSARQEIETLTEGFAENLPFGGGWRFALTPLEEELLGEVRLGLWILLAAVGLVLLIASLNAAAICLARARDRSAELTLRSVLGAGRWTLVRQLLVEHLLLAALGGLGGILLAHGLLRAILWLSPGDLPRLEQVSIDSTVLGFSLAVTMLAGLLAASFPALRSRRLQPAAQAGGWWRTGTVRASRTRRLLVAAQVTVVTVLLVGAVLMVRSFLEVIGVDFGMRTGGVWAVSLDLRPDRYVEPHQQAGFFAAALEQIRRLPGVEAAGATTGLPTRGVHQIDSSFHPEGQPEPLPLETAIDAVSPDYFRAAGIPILRGRPFQAPDGPGSPRAAILNESLARAAFPETDPVGRRVLASDDETWLTVVGVAGDVKQYGLDRDTPLLMYLPLAQQPASRAHLLVAADRHLPELAGMVKQLLYGMDPEQPIEAVRPMEDVLSESIAARRFPALLLGGFALLSLLLALAGIYGMLAHLVSRRTHEMGIRLAVGAGKSDLVRLILAPALRLSLAGLAVGLLGALAVTRTLESQLFGVRALDPATFALVIVSVLLVSLLAGYVPARRAAATDPVQALRHE